MSEQLEPTTEELMYKIGWLEEALKDYASTDNADDKLITANIQLRYELEALAKKLKEIKTFAKELLECSEGSKDSSKETRYICASRFLQTELKDFE
jgi:hypothetical protein